MLLSERLMRSASPYQAASIAATLTLHFAAVRAESDARAIRAAFIP